MSWPVFWTELTDEVELSLRRFVFAEREGADRAPRPPCPNGYHNALSPPIRRQAANRGPDGVLPMIEVVPEAVVVDGVDPTAVSMSDPRWPTACSCGYEFAPDDEWQVWQSQMFRRPDTGEEWTERTLPVGAMFDHPWYHHWGVGPDGLALVVILPPEGEDSRVRWWHVDGPARGEGTQANAWTRTGDVRAVPPTVDVNPSILTADYHGFLRHGVLTDPV